MSPESHTSVEVFYSYAHEDEKLRDELKKHLSNLKRQGVITDWYDRDITAGSEWDNEIKQHLESARVILLLISPDFMNSDYINNVEVKRAMERHEAGEAGVIPVILRPVDWQGAPFSKLQSLPSGVRPVTLWPNQDQAFLDVTKGIRRALEELFAPSVGTPASLDILVVDTLTLLGSIAHAEGDREAARSLHKQSLDIAGNLGNKQGIAVCLNELGKLHLEEKDHNSAQICLQKSLEILRNLGDEINCAECLESIGNLRVAQGRLSEAPIFFGEALEIASRLGIQRRFGTQNIPWACWLRSKITISRQRNSYVRDSRSSKEFDHRRLRMLVETSKELKANCLQCRRHEMFIDREHPSILMSPFMGGRYIAAFGAQINIKTTAL